MEKTKEEKPIHIVHCSSCDGVHRFSLKHTVIGNAVAPDLELPSESTLLESAPFQCPVTGKDVRVCDAEWEHLTEEEFHVRFPGNRNI